MQTEAKRRAFFEGFGGAARERSADKKSSAATVVGDQCPKKSIVVQSAGAREVMDRLRAEIDVFRETLDKATPNEVARFPQTGK